MSVLAPDDVIAALRRPKLIFTQDFLNDPIEFPPDPRFIPVTVLKQLNIIEIIDRDQAEFAIIELNSELDQSNDRYYPSTMFSPTYNRDDVKRIIDVNITQLLQVQQ